MAKSANRTTRLFKLAVKTLFKGIRRLTPTQFVVLVLIIGIGVFNGITGAMPQIKQHNRERNIQKTFDQWWQDAGEEQFRSVGLEPTPQLKKEEFQSYREKYLSQNPSYVVKEQVKTMAQEYRQWWEIQGGKELFIQEHGRYPTEADFRNTLEKKIIQYTDQFARYNMAFVPKHAHYERLLTSWILCPNILNYLIFAPLFLFAFIRMQKRWSLPVLTGFIALFSICGGVVADFFASTSFFDHYAGERYMGMSLTLAFILGATAFAPKKELTSQIVTAIAVAGLILDVLVNWFLNPGIFGSVAITEPVCFGLGALAGVKIETRRKTRKEINAEALRERLMSNSNKNPMAERKAKTRALVEEGFKAAKETQFEKSKSLLSQALTSLLQEIPVDTKLVKSVAERMASPSLYIDVSSMQWLEWGEMAKAKNAPEAALILLRKGLSTEKDAFLARRALFTLGEICVNNEIEYSNGIHLLEKVIAMNENDMMAKQARRMLDEHQKKSDS
ncbi:MAG: hypothetical protein MJZ26_11010 [Fibrobacter sp.]|nr:hypothetical protein [Fibrobacter sp.]